MPKKPHKSNKKKRELFKNRHPEGRKAFAKAKRKARVEKKLLKAKLKKQNV